MVFQVAARLKRLGLWAGFMQWASGLRGQLFQGETGQYRDVSDGYLECSERTQWASQNDLDRADQGNGSSALGQI